MAGRPTVFLVGTRWFGVLGPCRGIIQDLEERGCRVVVFGQRDDHWMRYHNGRTKLVRIWMGRSYTSFAKDAMDVVKLVAYGLYYRPRVIHSFNPKPALLSFAAALWFPRTHLLIGVTGLGNTFIRAKRLEGWITRLLRLACARASGVFFQNPDDKALFAERRIGRPERYRMFIGPGVDLSEFDWRKRRPSVPGDPVRVFCVARLIWQKGIREYVEAARRLRLEFGERVEFHLIGDFDREHPDCVPESYISEATAEGVIRHLRWTDQLPEVLSGMDVAVLHSYREGAPRAILEAAAMKIPTVGSDAIGVRELIVSGETGLLTLLGSVDALVDALRGLILDGATRRRFGENAFHQVAEPLSLARASEAQLEMYRAAGV